MQDSQYELVIGPSRPPATYREIHPDLKDYARSNHMGRGFFIFLAALLCTALIWNVDWRAALLVFLFFGYLIRLVFSAGKRKQDYSRYASWIFSCVRGRNEELTIAEKFVDRNSKRYFVNIKNEKGEELYDVEAISGKKLTFEQDAPCSANVLRDPRNESAVVATVGNTRLWLKLHMPY